MSSGEKTADKRTQRFVKVKPPKPQPMLPAFQKSRLLLSHLGFLNFGGLKDNSFHMLSKTPALYRDIKGLDKKLGRETVKVAVIYVKHGQETEQSILGNECGSVQYENFVKSLGWEVCASHDLTTRLISQHIQATSAALKNPSKAGKRQYITVHPLSK